MSLLTWQGKIFNTIFGGLLMKKVFLSRLVYSILVASLLFVFVFRYIPSVDNPLSVDAFANEYNKTETEVLSYVDIFNYYYGLIDAGTKSKLNLTIEKFMDAYYSHDLSIDEFTDNISNIDFSEKSRMSNNGIVQRNGVLQILSPDEKYILGKNIGDSDYTEKTDFRRELVANAYNYSSIREGDIIYESASSSAARHVAFVYNCSQPSYYGNYVQTVESVAGGVQYGFLDDDRFVRFGVSIYRIYRAGELGVVDKAIKFISLQIGKNYSMDFTKTKTDISSNGWYCSELVFAAYYYGGMEIASNRDFDFDQTTMPCLPIYLTKGLLSMPLITNYDYLIMGPKSYHDSFLWNNGYWNIAIKNPNDTEVTVYYNSKMCNVNDAKNWSNSLKDIKTIVIPANSIVTVQVNQNLFATTVVASYIFDGYRYVTYTTDLSKVDYSANFSYNKIKVD